MNIFPALLLFSAGATQVLANIDPIQVEGNELIAPGIYAQNSTAAKIRRLNITQQISDLYSTFQPVKEEGVGVSYVGNECFAVYIKTENGLPEFIEQISVKDPKCVNK